MVPPAPIEIDGDRVSLRPSADQQLLDVDPARVVERQPDAVRVVPQDEREPLALPEQLPGRSHRLPARPLPRRCVTGRSSGHGASMTVKLTVVYDNPTNPDAFEQHYNDVHKPMVGTLPSVQRVELAKVFPKEDGSPTPAYRVADLYFADYDTAVAALSSEQGQALAKDAMQLGQAGVKFLLCEIES